MCILTVNERISYSELRSVYETFIGYFFTTYLLTTLVVYTTEDVETGTPDRLDLPGRLSAHSRFGYFEFFFLALQSMRGM